MSSGAEARTVDRLLGVLTATEVRSLLGSGDGAGAIATGDGLVFVYRGPAESVDLVVMEDRFQEVGPMARVDDGDAWWTQVLLPSDAIIEYKLAVTKGGKRRLVLDPGNTARSRDPFGYNSIATGLEYRSPDWLDGPAQEGYLTSIEVESRVWNARRDHYLYRPNGYEAATPGTLLVLHDGPDYVEYSGINRCLDFLCSSRTIEPPLVLLHRPVNRNSEYTDNLRHIAHVLDELVPMVKEEHAIDRIVAGGVSLGGVAALSLAFRRAGTIDALMLQSASLVLSLRGKYKRGPVLEPAMRLVAEILDRGSGLPDHFAMSCGTFDGLVEDHRELIPRLGELVGDLFYEEINAGHHWLCWRDRLEPDLVAALGRQG